jgi:hypothetical protein
MEAFDIIGSPIGAAVDVSNYTLVVITAAYFILVRFIGYKGVFDPLYVRKCSAGSLVEICKTLPNRNLAVKICGLWSASISLLTAMTYLNISSVILEKILATNMPSIYTALLIGVFLAAACSAYVTKLIISVLIFREKKEYCAVKVVDCFW